ncbi:DUF2929 family protein [Rossellomorea marisflavi]|uniref:Uncharacterized protein n=1 Tax=Rossellomorea marisflavi TaxID=189381 RepID=A0A0J5TGV3_9BACI|nr:DUF2929 family protein [Rossellomorea marisflavi]KMK96799.1 DeoR faimly transcriptional regulator [Rossellomorea marisflavi]KML06157.1 DeoR faimly transcriptional regulator [Rossellomorea marisflavi]KML32548.1 DeoR faimly transcriptional regulator [Rossellomorea marisflavi]KZE49527.1 hypothetical protein AV649_00400 [Rossellomorea marisflavi]MCM2603806.1 YjzD family protein [Rossellomorea marisflavi]
MRFFWMFFWAFALTEMLTYVVANMSGGKFDFMQGLILSVAVTILAYIVTLILPNEPVEDH